MILKKRLKKIKRENNFEMETKKALSYVPRIFFLIEREEINFWKNKLEKLTIRDYLKSSF